MTQIGTPTHILVTLDSDEDVCFNRRMIPTPANSQNVRARDLRPGDIIWVNSEAWIIDDIDGGVRMLTVYALCQGNEECADVFHFLTTHVVTLVRRG